MTEKSDAIDLSFQRDGLMGEDEVAAYKRYLESLPGVVDIDAAVADLDSRGLTQAGMLRQTADE